MKAKHNKKITPDNESVRHQDRRVLFLPLILIIALGVIAYANALNGKFIWDDVFLIKNNITIRSPWGLLDCFSKDIHVRADRVYPFYRPLQAASYTLDYAFWKLNVVGYHFTNIVLHILVALSIYRLISVLYNDRTLSLLTAGLFIVHPIHTEAVSYISGRADSLAALFMILCFIIYIKQLNPKSQSIPGYILLLVIYLGALFSKENSLILPVLIVFYHFVFKKKIKYREFLSLAGMAAIYMAMRLTYLKPVLLSHYSDTVVERIPGLFVAIASYIRLLVFPFSLHMEYGLRMFTFTDPRVIIGIIITILFLACAYLKRSHSVIFFSIGWFFLALFPVSNLYRIDAYMAEHFLYLPSIGFFLILAYPLSIIYSHKKYRLLAFILITVVLVSYSFLTIRQNRYWSEPVTFYERTLNFAPDSARVYNNLGNARRKKGNSDQAILDLTKAIELNPDFAPAHNSLGDAYSKKGNLDQAVLEYTRAIELNPDFAEAYNNLGDAYGKKGNLDQAILEYTRAIELNPDFAEAYNNLGNAYSKKSNLDQAILEYSKAIKLNPDFAEAYNNLGEAYGKKGNLDQAILEYTEAIKLNPSFAEAYNNRGVAYGKKGDLDQGINDFTKAIELNPEYAKAYNNRGFAYGKKGNSDQAILEYTRAIELNPNLTEAYNNRGVAYYYKQEYDKAWDDIHKTEELGGKPGFYLFEALKKASGREK